MFSSRQDIFWTNYILIKSRQSYLNWCILLNFRIFKILNVCLDLISFPTLEINQKLEATRETLSTRKLNLGRQLSGILTYPGHIPCPITWQWPWTTDHSQHWCSCQRIEEWAIFSQNSESLLWPMVVLWQTGSKGLLYLS